MCHMPYANNKGADQLDQRLCCSLSRQNDTSSLYIRNFKILAGLCRWAGQLVSCLVANSEDRFSRGADHLFYQDFKIWRVENFLTSEKLELSDYSPAIALSEEKTTLVTKLGRQKKEKNNGMNKHKQPDFSKHNTMNLCLYCYTPPQKSGGVLCYTLRTVLSVCPSVNQSVSASFPDSNLSRF